MNFLHVPIKISGCFEMQLKWNFMWTELVFMPVWNLKPVWVHFASHVSVLCIEYLKSVISFCKTAFLVVRLSTFLSFTWVGLKFDFELIMLNLVFVNKNSTIFSNIFIIPSFPVSKHVHSSLNLTFEFAWV